MEPTPDRRNDQNERVPVHIDVELGQGDFDDAFAANSLDLSTGGISMRALCLPDIGSRLLLRFQCLPSGRIVTAQGEVVWAHLDGDRCGEFGISFLNLDQSSEWLIEEMLAEHVDDGCERPPAAEAAANVGTLELEGGASGLAARLAGAAGSEDVRAAEHEPSRLADAMRAPSAAEGRKRSSISAVELRMVGSVPMLAVTVTLGEGRVPHANLPRAVEPVPERAADGAAGTAHDTEPDLEAPRLLDAGRSQATGGASASDASALRVTLAEFELESSAAAELPEPQAPAKATAEVASIVEAAPADAPAAAGTAATADAQALDGMAAAAADAHAAEDMAAADDSALAADTADVVELPPAAAAAAAAKPAAPPPAPARIAAREIAGGDPAVAPQPVVRRPPPRPPRQLEFESDAGSDYSTSFALPRRDDELDYALEEMTTPAWKPAVASALRVIGEQSNILLGWAGRELSAAYRRALPQLRFALVRASALLRAVYALRVAPLLGATRRFARTQLRVRRRRTTGGPGLARQTSSTLGRTLVLGVLGAGATALGVYALVPGDSGEIDLHRPVQAAATSAESAATPEAAAMPETAAPAASVAETALARSEPVATPDPKKVPSARQVPAGSPFAVDVREGTGPAVRTEPAAKPLRFGAASVPRARRFALRMSGRVQGLQGATDPGGFSVTVLGALSLDRAGPISSSHKSVARSMIINKGDRAELNIRFAEGKRPAYQVSAEGNTLYLLIQDS